MPLAHQLVVLLGPSDGAEAGLCALARDQLGPSLTLRDAAVLVREGAGEIVANESTDQWAGRRRFGPGWWAALAHALGNHPNPWSKSLILAGVSRSFLAEIAEALEGGSTAVVMVADHVEIEQLLSRVEHASFVRVIYGLLPDAAIDELHGRAMT